MRLLRLDCLRKPDIENMEEGERGVRNKGGEREGSKRSWQSVELVQLLEPRQTLRFRGWSNLRIFAFVGWCDLGSVCHDGETVSGWCHVEILRVELSAKACASVPNPNSQKYLIAMLRYRCSLLRRELSQH